jgi:hypothetical protein
VYRSVLALSVSLLALSACARERAPAPDDVDGLSRFLFTHWEDPDLMADGMTNLAIWIQGDGLGEQARTEGFVLGALTAEEIGPIEYPTRTPLSAMVGVAVTHDSPYSLEEHAELLPMQDQTWNAPRKYELYDRSLVEGTADDFLHPEAPVRPEIIRTDNDIVQARVGVRIPYRLRKDYRWVLTDDGQRAIVGRTWAPEVGCSGQDGEGGNCLELSFSVDLFLETADGRTLRMTSSWNRLSLILELSDDFQIAQLANGIVGVFEDTDEFLEERHGAAD